MSCLKHIISVILPDTFSYNLLFCASFCGAFFLSLGVEEKQSIFLSYLVERRLSTWSLISCTLKTVHMQGALPCYQGDGSNFKLSVSHGNIRDLMSTATCQRLLWSGGERNLSLIHSTPFTCQYSAPFHSGWWFIMSWIYNHILLRKWRGQTVAGFKNTCVCVGKKRQNAQLLQINGKHLCYRFHTFSVNIQLLRLTCSHSSGFTDSS